jgi:hypothetical protein
MPKFREKPPRTAIAIRDVSGRQSRGGGVFSALVSASATDLLSANQQGQDKTSSSFSLQVRINSFEVQLQHTADWHHFDVFPNTLPNTLFLLRLRISPPPGYLFKACPASPIDTLQSIEV